MSRAATAASADVTKRLTRHRQAVGGQDCLGIELMDGAALRDHFGGGRGLQRARWCKRRIPLRQPLDRAEALARATDDRDTCVREDTDLAAVQDARPHRHEVMWFRALRGCFREKLGIVLLAAGAAERLVVDGVAAAEDDRVGCRVLAQQPQRLRRRGAKIAASPGVERIAVAGDAADIALNRLARRCRQRMQRDACRCRDVEDQLGLSA